MFNFLLDWENPPKRSRPPEPIRGLHLMGSHPLKRHVGVGGGGGGGVSSYAGTYQVPFIGPQTFGSVIVSSGSRTFSTPGTYTWICPPGVTSVDTQCWSGGGGGGGGCSSFGGDVQLAFNSNQTFGTPSIPMSASAWYSLTGPQFQTNQLGQGTITIIPAQPNSACQFLYMVKL